MVDPLRCPSCGAPVVPGARFCFQCGSPLDLMALEHHERHGERRVVTVLFGDLSDFTAWSEDLDPERVGHVTDRVLAALASSVQAYGGHVDKLTGDGIMAVFGAPTAHEDDPERAVRAAASMQAAVSRLVAEEAGGGRRLGLRVGLNTGEVLAGVQAQLSYTVVGDTVNTASRLSDAAGVGAVLAGRDTALATMTMASWRALAPLRLKGKRDLVPAYELIALRTRSADRFGIGDEAPLTGREAELGTLLARWRAVTEEGRPASIVLTGEAGIGKSRIARELARAAGEAPHARVLHGRCSPYGEARDLAPLVEMVRTACAITEEDEEDIARVKVRRTVSRLEHPAFSALSGGPLTERLLGLLGLGADGGTPRESITPGDPQQPEVVEVLAGLFGALARQGPLLLVVDDLHWAGPALLQLLGSVAARLEGPVLLVAVGRPDLLVSDRAWTELLPDATHLPLFPLETSAAARLLRSYLGGQDLDSSVERALVDRAQGNPFFLAELLRLLVDRGTLRREGSAWVLDGGLPDAMLPAGVQAVLAARIDSLDPGVKIALRDAAVVGATFWVPALAALAGVSIETARERVGALVDRDIAVPLPDGEAFTFAHTLTREVAYAAVPKADRARRHAAAAAWAAAEMPGSPAEIDATVAAHAERAVRLAQEMGLLPPDPAWAAAAVGFAALSRVGRAALARDDNSQAVEVLARAMELGASLPEAETAATRVAYAEALGGLHRLDAALAEIDSALTSEDAGLRAEALVVLGDVRRKQADDDAATTAFVQALAAAGAAGLDRVAGAAMRQLGLIDYFNGRLGPAVERFTQAYDLAERVGDSRGMGWALQHLAWSATTRGDYPLAEQMLARASEVFASFDDAGGLGWCAGTEAFVRLLQGRLEDARQLTRSIIALAEEAGDLWSIGALMTIDSVAAAEMGYVTEARQEGAEASEIFAGVRDSWGLTISTVAKGLAARAAGDHDEARQLLGEAVRMGQSLQHPAVQMLALVSLGWVAHDERDLELAEDCADRAHALVSDLDLAAHTEIGVRVLQALIARGRGDLESALAILGEIAGSPESPTLLFPMRQALAHYAGTLLEAGRVDEALAVAERAQAVPADDIRSRVIALRALGNSLAAAGKTDEARATLEDALDLATSTEHRLEEPATRAALAALPAL